MNRGGAGFFSDLFNTKYSWISFVVLKEEHCLETHLVADNNCIIININIHISNFEIVRRKIVTLNSSCN